MSDYIGLPFPASMYDEFIIRKGGSVDVAAWVEQIVQDYLDRTRDDPNIWSDEYVERLEEIEADERVEEYGLPSKGYEWQNLFLPNGTQLRMTYKGRVSMAEVKHQQIWCAGEVVSPSEFASRVANNTNRNAWRDILIRTPGSHEFILAAKLRREARQRESHDA